MNHEARWMASLTARYEIRVRGELGAGWSSWFTGLAVAAREDGETVLIGTLDQAALHAVLRRIRDLGLPLISMRRMGPEGAAPKESIESREDES